MSTSESERQMPGVFNVGFTRYAIPLNDIEQKKFDALAGIARFHVLGLSTRARGVRLDSSASFRLLPLLPFAPLRFASIFLMAIVHGYRLARTGAISVFLSQSPYEGLAGVILRKLLSWRGVPMVLICEVHGDFLKSPFLYRFIPLRFLVRPMLRAWSGYVLRRSDAIRTISSSLEELVDALAPSVPRRIFPTYTDFERFVPSKADPPEGIVLLSVGALYPVKGFGDLLEALPRLVHRYPELELRIVGEGPERGRLEARVKALGLERNVRLLGALSPQRVLEEYHRARVFVLASRSEGLGRVVLEAMLCGIPVVATDSGGVRDLVDERSGYLVPVGDVDVLSERIGVLLDRPEEAAAMGRRGHESLASRYSTEAYVEGYRDLFELAKR